MPVLNAQSAAASQSDAMQGMNMARRMEIPPGQVLYRFYDSQRAPTPSLGAHGAWWVEFDSFQAIKHFAQRNGHSFSYAARLFAAILYEWSEVDAYVACQTLGILAAWKGTGKQVRPKRADPRDLPTMTPMQGPVSIYQLYIPGLAGSGSIAPTALRVRSHGLL